MSASLKSAQEHHAPLSNHLNTQRWTSQADDQLLRLAKIDASAQPDLATASYQRCIDLLDWPALCARLNELRSSSTSSRSNASSADEEDEQQQQAVTPEECRERCLVLVAKIPKYRTLVELIELGDSVQLAKFISQQRGQRITPRDVQKCWKHMDEARHIYIYNMSSKKDKEYPDAATRYANKWDKMGQTKKLEKAIKILRKCGKIDTELKKPKKETAVPKKVAKAKPSRMTGEPKSIPSNIYSLFTKNITTTVLKGYKGPDRLSRVAELWKECTEEKKQELNKELVELKSNYLKELTEFRKSLSSEEDLQQFDKKFSKLFKQ